MVEPLPRLLAQLSEIASAAGEVVMVHYANAAMPQTKSDGTPVTEADFAADRLIRKELTRQFPGVFILSEESLPAVMPAVADPLFLVDPLDGTREFISRSGEFTVNIAMVEGGTPIAGVVCAPAVGVSFAGAPGQGAWRRNGRDAWTRLAAPSPARSGPVRVIGSRSHGTDRLQAWLARWDRPCTFVAAGSSLKFCRLAEGAADLYARFGPTSQWDTAAGQAVLEAAGGEVCDAGGQRLRYGVDRPLLNPDFIALARCGTKHPPLD